MKIDGKRGGNLFCKHTGWEMEPALKKGVLRRTFELSCISGPSDCALEKHQGVKGHRLDTKERRQKNAGGTKGHGGFLLAISIENRVREAERVGGVFVRRNEFGYSNPEHRNIWIIGRKAPEVLLLDEFEGTVDEAVRAADGSEKGREKYDCERRTRISCCDSLDKLDWCQYIGLGVLRKRSGGDMVVSQAGCRGCCVDY